MKKFLHIDDFGAGCFGVIIVLAIIPITVYLLV